MISDDLFVIVRCRTGSFEANGFAGLLFQWDRKAKRLHSPGARVAGWGLMTVDPWIVLMVFLLSCSRGGVDGYAEAGLGTPSLQ